MFLNDFFLNEKKYWVPNWIFGYQKSILGHQQLNLGFKKADFSTLKIEFWNHIQKSKFISNKTKTIVIKSFFFRCRLHPPTSIHTWAAFPHTY